MYVIVTNLVPAKYAEVDVLGQWLIYLLGLWDRVLKPFQSGAPRTVLYLEPSNGVGGKRPNSPEGAL